jgi:hypothetical protein
VTIKRLILALLTVLAIAKVFFSLEDSLSQPQIQSRLELYQTNLVLHVSELQPNSLDISVDKNADFKGTIDSLIGADPYATAEKQYQKARQEAKISLTNFQARLEQLSYLTAADSQSSEVTIIVDTQQADTLSPQQQQLTTAIAEIDEFIEELDVKIGILLAAQDKTNEAIKTWNKLIEPTNNSESKFKQTAVILKNSWSQSPQVLNNAESNLKTNLDGWFRYRTLQKLYQLENRQDDLSTLQAQQQELATKAIFKLALISGIPVLGGIGGIILLIFLIVQLFWKQEKSILAINSQTGWQTPWNWEITWQVLIVGFFFIGQFVLPILIGLSGFDPSGLNLRFKALYVLVTYILMAVAGISVLYLSIKSRLPLPEDWFRFKLTDKWFFWGFGGYLIALPLVLLISLVNQQIWQGQGGSNPLLFLALQAQDRVALAIFFITASIAAPIFEEIMFRGFLLPSLTRYVPASAAIVVSGLIFAIAHLSLSEVLPLATLGIILGIVYTRSRNLLAPMLVHSLWNSGTLLSLFLLGSGLS